ncbi:MAG: cupin domain-containing protein [Desulfobacteraceae bacterium]|nr:cupin domain-containing protein [Desulfobacteraceae bacterium]
METNKISTDIANGTVHYADRSEKLSDAERVEHPQFKGVYLKLMIKGADTSGRFSSHLVRIAPECTLENHCHENQLELHEVLEGEGSCRLMDKRFDYHSGKMAVIPKGENHMVRAGKNGLILAAKFFPAMV